MTICLFSRSDRRDLELGVLLPSFRAIDVFERRAVCGELAGEDVSQKYEPCSAYGLTGRAPGGWGIANSRLVRGEEPGTEDAIVTVVLTGEPSTPL